MKRILSLLLALLLLATVMVGCSNNDKTESPAPSQAPSQAPGGSDDEPSDEPSAYFPLAEKAEISIWAEWVFDQLPLVFTEWNDAITYQLLEKATNVHINFDTPSFGSEKERLQLLMASQDYPDIIGRFDGYYTAGIMDAVDNGIAVKLDDYIDQYMPNYKKYFSDPDLKKRIKTDGGYVGAIYMMNNVVQNPWNGMGIRKDYLDQLGLDIPETYDELHDVLKAFKDELGLPAPMNLDGFGAYVGDHMNWLFSPGYGVIGTIYAENGVTAKYGVIDPVYREYIEMLRNWYAEGLIDPNFESNNPLFGNGEVMLLNDEVGYTIGADFIGTWEECYQQPVNPEYYLYPVPCMVRNKGEHTKFGVYRNIVEVASIVTTSVEPDRMELVCRWIDNCFTDESFIAMNFGEEGTTFFYDENNEPTLNVEWCEDYFNTEFFNVQRALVCIRLPYRRDLYRNREGHKNTGVQRETFWLSGEIWSQDDGSWLWPGQATMTADESSRYNSLYSDINTLFVETATRVIKGNPMSEWDKAIQTALNLGVEQLVQIKQDSLDRFNAR